VAADQPSLEQRGDEVDAWHDRAVETAGKGTWIDICGHRDISRSSPIALVGVSAYVSYVVRPLYRRTASCRQDRPRALNTSYMPRAILVAQSCVLIPTLRR